MPRFLLSFRVPNKPLGQAIADLGGAARARAELETWFGSLGDALIERSRPVSDVRPVGSFDVETRIGGYAIVEADDFDAAVEMANRHPGLRWGRVGGIEVGEFMDIAANAAPRV